MGDHEHFENGIGPIYSVPLIDALPLNPDKPDGTLQQMPSVEDLTGIKNYRQGMRVCAGYETLLHHWRIQKQQIERLRKVVGCVVRNCEQLDERPRDEPGPLAGPTWEKVAYVCGLGSTSATELCREFGVDPHSEPDQEADEEEG
jgi:hypothetical protein